MSCNLLAVAAKNGIKVAKKNPTNNQPNIDAMFIALIINIAYKP